MTQLGGGGVLKSRFLAHMKKVKVERYILRSSLMHMLPNAPNRGPRKIQKIVQKCTKMDFLTPKCVKEPPKPPAHKSSSSMRVAREIGLSKGQNWSPWRPLENCQNGNFFPKNSQKWTFWPLNVPQTSWNILHKTAPVLCSMHAKSDGQNVQIEARGGHLKIDRIFWKCKILA